MKVDSKLKFTTINHLGKEVLGGQRKNGHHNKQIVPTIWSVEEELNMQHLTETCNSMRTVNAGSLLTGPVSRNMLLYSS